MERTTILKKERKEKEEQLAKRIIRAQRNPQSEAYAKMVTRVEKEMQLIDEAINYIEKLNRPIRHGGYSDVGICLEWLENNNWKEIL